MRQHCVNYLRQYWINQVLLSSFKKALTTVDVYSYVKLFWVLRIVTLCTLKLEKNFYHVKRIFIFIYYLFIHLL